MLRVATAAMRAATSGGAWRSFPRLSPRGMLRAYAVQASVACRVAHDVVPVSRPSACSGPAALSAPTTVSPQTQTLLDAVTAEQNLIWIYNRAITAYSGLAPTLAPLRAEHEAHLAELRASVIEPPGTGPRHRDGQVRSAPPRRLPSPNSVPPSRPRSRH